MKRARSGRWASAGAATMFTQCITTALRRSSQIRLSSSMTRRAKMSSLTTGSAYFARMQLGRLIDAALSEQADAYIRDVYSVLRDTAVASRANKPIGDKMIMNAAFLVERDREAEFDSKVNELAAKYEGKCSFKYTGPWPPYNFVHIRLKLERGEGTA